MNVIVFFLLSFFHLKPSFEHNNTIGGQGHLQVSENKRIHVNGCPRMGVIVFSSSYRFPTNTHSLHVCGAPRHDSLVRGYYTIPLGFSVTVTIVQVWGKYINWVLGPVG